MLQSDDSPRNSHVYENRFTVITPTHHEGLENPFVVQQWNILEDVVDKIIIVWDKPVEENLKRMQTVLARNTIPIEFYVNRTYGSLNNRFRPFDRIRTQFVFQLDDDILIRPKGILAAFETAKANPLRLVSFHGRHRIRRDPQTKEAKGYEAHWPTADVETGHLGLTAAGMVATDFMRLYWSADMAKIRQFVDSVRNCEDIAMNYVIEHELRRLARRERLKVSRIHGGTAIHIFPKLKGLSWANVSKAVEGISEGGNHMHKRNMCVREFERLTNYKLDQRKPIPAVSWAPQCIRGHACEDYMPDELRVDPVSKAWHYPKHADTNANLTSFLQPDMHSHIFDILPKKEKTSRDSSQSISMY